MLNTLPNCVTDNDREQIRRILLKNAYFLARHDYDCGETNLIQCDLQLKDPTMQLIAQPLRRHATSRQPIIDAEVERMVNAGILTKNPSPTWASHVVLVQELPIGNGPPEYRLTIDARQFNQALCRTQYVLPHIDSIIDSLAQARFFNCLDFCNAYHAIKLTERSR